MTAKYNLGTLNETNMNIQVEVLILDYAQSAQASNKPGIYTQFLMNIA